MNIIYLFRSQEQKLYSVERVFHSIIPQIAKRADVEEQYMPRYRARPDSILENLRFAKRLNGDVIHITGDVYYAALSTPSDKTIVTVLDMVSLENSSGFKRAIIKLLWYRYPLKKCKYITCISEKTKQELLGAFPNLANKTFVVECPVSDEYVFLPRKFNKDHPVILQIGTKDNKNLIRLAEAVDGIDCELIIVGKLKDEQIQALEQHSVEYTNVYHITDAEMVELYRNCDMLAFVSTYEGFGVPIIEAQATGRPVITSNIEPMVSVAGDGAVLVNPLDVSDIRRGILRIINDNEYREGIVNAGKQNALRFSTEAIAKKYYKLYEKVIQSEGSKV
ncbi:glycosyltransferase family 4 protein [Chordicoccus furentiruminis]|uniref:glycosyltransferase family 4 protein n=1 Tax=Chordicoccus furentiruminis TaxID=2709410 RepID=UPI0023A8B806|nr:glycosyltransferase family 1 protein [Chordicoccus furentiruminis]